MELRRYLRLIRQRILLVVVCLIVGVAVGYTSTSKTALYRSSATIYVGSRAVATDPQQIYDQLGISQIATTFATMIPNEVIAQAAIEATHVPRNAYEVAGNIKAAVVPSTTLISVSVTDVDPVVAQALTNGVVNAFAAKVQNYNGTPTGAPGELPAEPAYVYQPAYLPTAPLAIPTKSHAILGGLFGLVVAVLAVFLLDYLDVTAKSPEDLERRVDLPVLGIIPYNRRLEDREAAVASARRSARRSPVA